MLDIDSPAVDAIFSPATAAAEKSIFKISPTESPIPISNDFSDLTATAINLIDEVLNSYREGN